MGVRRPGFVRRPWSLRARLLAGLLGLLAVVCLLLGAVTQVVLHQQLMGQIDSQLLAAGGRSSNAVDRPPPMLDEPTGGSDTATATGHGTGGTTSRAGSGVDHDDRGPGFLVAPGQGAGTLGARLTSSGVTEAAYLDASGSLQPVGVAQRTMLAALAADARPYTRDLGTLGTYRLLASPVPNGDVVITGLPLQSIETTQYQMLVLWGLLVLLGLLAATFAGRSVISVALRPLRRVAATAVRVAELPLERGDVELQVRVPDIDTDPRTEVGRVGAAFNRMLGHVDAALAARQASETRVRKFVADASHELRTPLAAIRGYAELTHRSRDGAPPDVVHALSRIETQAARMSALVDDLLLLARLDSGRPLAHDPVDLSRLVLEAVADARAAGPDHLWRLSLPDAAVVISGDDSRLHQVVSNLLTNARVHTPAGTTVHCSIRRVGSAGAQLTIEDDGPGIPAALQPDVFERFARGDSSRSRAAGSTGLGLAIVSAVVEAHGGTIHLASSPGATTFTIDLPAREPDAPEPPVPGATVPGTTVPGTTDTGPAPTSTR